MAFPYDVTSAIMKYEDGCMNAGEQLELFQYLVDTGLAWQLQGSYGRTAHAMLHAGLIHPAKGGNHGQANRHSTS